MEIRRLRTLALEIFETLNNLNPKTMKYIFNFSRKSTHKKHCIFVQNQIHPIMVAKNSELLDHIHENACQETLNSPLL